MEEKSHQVRLSQLQANTAPPQPVQQSGLYPSLKPRSRPEVVDLTGEVTPSSSLHHFGPSQRTSAPSAPSFAVGNGITPPAQSWALPARNKHAGPSRVRMLDVSALPGDARSASPSKTAVDGGASSSGFWKNGRQIKAPVASSQLNEVSPEATSKARVLPSAFPSTSSNGATSAAQVVSDDDEDEGPAGIALPQGPDARASPSEREVQLQNMLSSMVLAPELGDVDIEKASRIEGLNCQLLPHQVAGYLWLKGREAGVHKGGILADDMGLGKTVQMLALLIGNSPKRADRTIDLKGKNTAMSKSKDKQIEQAQDLVTEERISLNSNSSLVIAPLAVIRQWEREIKEKSLPPLRVLVHHGPQRVKDESIFKRYDVVITTYTTAASEFANLYPSPQRKQKSKVGTSARRRPADSSDSHSESSSDVSSNEDDDMIYAARSKLKKPSAKKGASPLFECDWLRVILDEAQNIKNHKTQMSQAAAMLSRRALSKWCLSGTPIQNDCLELFSLIRFLGIPPFDNLAHFKEKIADPLKSANQNRVNWGMKRLCAVLATIMLRRTKTSQYNGQPILSLPERTVQVISTDFYDEKERSFYEDLENQVKKNISDAEDSGKKMNHMITLLMLLRLRQSCNHPALLNRDIKIDAGAASGKDAGNGTAPGRNGHPSAGSVADEDDDDGLADLLSGLSVVSRRCDRCQVELPTSDAKEGARHCEQCHLRLSKELEAKGKGSPWSSVASTKIRAMLKILGDIQREGKDKTIIFSQFTSFLDLIEPFLRERGYVFSRYDGSLRPAERERALERIRSDDKTRIILISFKAGNTGLNLTSCSRVILMDLWWNPMLEAQAIDRSHRLGQRRPVVVYKIVIQRSVEERILTLQEKKRALAEAALEGSKLTKQNRLDRHELMYLFSGGPIG